MKNWNSSKLLEYVRIIKEKTYHLMPTKIHQVLQKVKIHNYNNTEQKYRWLGLVWFVFMVYQGYLMPDLLYTYIKYTWFGLVGFYGISTIVGYLMPDLLYTYIKYTWFGLVGFYGISTIVGYLMPNPLNTYIRYIWFGWVLWHINHCWLFHAKPSLYIY